MFPEVYNDARTSARVNREESDQDQGIGRRLLRDERLLAGLLAATAMFMMYYFY